MVSAILANLALSSSNRRDQIVQNVIQKIDTLGPRFGATVVQAQHLPRLTPDSTLTLRVLLRFINEADRDELVTDMENQLVGQFLPVTGSWYELHDCFHDEDPPSGCVVTLRRTW